MFDIVGKLENVVKTLEQEKERRKWSKEKASIQFTKKIEKSMELLRENIKQKSKKPEIVGIDIKIERVLLKFARFIIRKQESLLTAGFVDTKTEDVKEKIISTQLKLGKHIIKSSQKLMDIQGQVKVSPSNIRHDLSKSIYSAHKKLFLHMINNLIHSLENTRIKASARIQEEALNIDKPKFEANLKTLDENSVNLHSESEKAYLNATNKLSQNILKYETRLNRDMSNNIIDIISQGTLEDDKRFSKMLRDTILFFENYENDNFLKLSVQFSLAKKYVEDVIKLKQRILFKKHCDTP